VNGAVYFNYAEFFKQAIFDNGTFFGRFEFIQSIFHYIAEFKNNTFYGKTKFTQANFGGKTFFDNSVFYNGKPNTEDIITTKDTDFTLENTIYIESQKLENFK